MLLEDRQQGNVGGMQVLKQVGKAKCDPLCCAAGGALSPNGILSPRAQARQEDFQGGSQPAEDLRHEHVHQPELASAVKSIPGMPAEAELPPMTPAEAQVLMTLCCAA